MTQPISPEDSLLRRLARWDARTGVTRKLAIVLAAGAVVSGVATSAALTGWGSSGSQDSQTVLALLYLDLVLVLLLSTVVLRHLVQLWLERRRGMAGSRMHIRLVALFSIVAVAPAIVVALYSLLFLNLGVEAWFSERVRTALTESLAVAEAYLDEHRQIIRADALAMANDINRSGQVLIDNPSVFSRFLATQATLRSLTEVMVFRRDGRVLGRSGLTFSLSMEAAPIEAMAQADGGEVVFVNTRSEDRVRALIRLTSLIDSYLYVGRFVDARAIGHMVRTQRAVSAYQQLEGKRSTIQLTFALIFGVVTLLLLLVAIWLGLTFATQLVRPIGNLVTAAEQVRAGDFTARVEEDASDDEIAGLSRAFNRMIDQLGSQRRELIDTNRQLDERRRFTESVLTGVSAGVIGLDSQGRIELPNRSALELLSSRADDLVGRLLSEAVPEMAPLVDKAIMRPDRLTETQITVSRQGRARTLLVRFSAERPGGELEGFVVTFDDITALVVAQRTAAWADVARRIAHEIKNPLTPIQLSAERIKRKYLGEIKSDPEAFITCTDTIVRHVGDIGRMIDEFTAFARMPAPVFKAADLAGLVHQAIALQELAHPSVRYNENFPDGPVTLRCDGGQVVQVLTNLLLNAVESIDGRVAADNGDLPPGRIDVNIEQDDARVVVEVCDNGRGLPVELRDRLVEPYVTTRAKGTGLGLAIVKKIMEDHGGELVLDDGPDGGACVRLVFRPRENESSVAAATPREVISHGA